MTLPTVPNLLRPEAIKIVTNPGRAKFGSSSFPLSLVLSAMVPFFLPFCPFPVFLVSWVLGWSLVWSLKPSDNRRLGNGQVSQSFGFHPGESSNESFYSSLTWEIIFPSHSPSPLYPPFPFPPLLFQARRSARIWRGTAGLDPAIDLLGHEDRAHEGLSLGESRLFRLRSASRPTRRERDGQACGPGMSASPRDDLPSVLHVGVDNPALPGILPPSPFLLFLFDFRLHNSGDPPFRYATNSKPALLVKKIMIT